MFIYLVAWVITFGLAFMIALTSGPFGLFGTFRNYIGRTVSIQWVKDGVSCPVCVSFWVGMVVAYWVTKSVGWHVVSWDQFFLIWLSSVGFVCVITSLSPD